MPVHKSWALKGTTEYSRGWNWKQGGGLESVTHRVNQESPNRAVNLLFSFFFFWMNKKHSLTTVDFVTYTYTDTFLPVDEHICFQCLWAYLTSLRSWWYCVGEIKVLAAEQCSKQRDGSAVKSHSTILQRLRRQISLDYYTISPATQANILLDGFVMKEVNEYCSSYTSKWSFIWPF